MDVWFTELFRSCCYVWLLLWFRIQSKNEEKYRNQTFHYTIADRTYAISMK